MNKDNCNSCKNYEDKNLTYSLKYISWNYVLPTLILIPVYFLFFHPFFAELNISKSILQIASAVGESYLEFSHLLSVFFVLSILFTGLFMTLFSNQHWVIRILLFTFYLWLSLALFSVQNKSLLSDVEKIKGLGEKIERLESDNNQTITNYQSEIKKLNQRLEELEKLLLP